MKKQLSGDSNPTLSLKAFSFAAFLSIGPFVVISEKLIGLGSVVLGLIQLSALLFLILPAIVSKTDHFLWFYGSSSGKLILTGLTLILVSIIFNFTILSILKWALLAVYLMVLPMQIPYIGQRSILGGAGIFSVVASFVIWKTFEEWNVNSVCLYVSLIALCGAAFFFGFRTKLSRFCGLFLLSLGLSTNFFLGSRTAILSLFLSVFVYYLFQRKILTVQKVRFIACAFVGATLLFYSPLISIANLGKSYLDNDSVFASFFLSDKDEDKLDFDMFDRRVVWNAAITTIIENPLTGAGYATKLPEKLVDGRSATSAHNAYLEIGYQCGVPAMIVWTCFYAFIFNFACSLILRKDNRPLIFLLFTSSLYLLLAGTMESSGMCSLAVTSNWLVISCFLYLYIKVNYSRVKRGSSVTQKFITLKGPKKRKVHKTT
ncbi:O-antigen ligase family protein [Akkermansiaceae bacterium]|nr:O-antigen ligase family protein [Akkermansiaceae bacterium]